jgi:hypothetical protein
MSGNIRYKKGADARFDQAPHVGNNGCADLHRSKFAMIKRLLLTGALVLALSSAGMAQTTYNEAPILAERVAAGELPPVEERLPAEPLVIEPVEQIGEYGGTWRMLDQNNELGFTLMSTGVEPFLKWNRDASGFRPNVLERRCVPAHRALPSGHPLV